MSYPKWAIPRRAFLQGLGATIGLPFLEAMTPYMVKAQAQGLSVPPRMIYLWFDLGVYKTDWVPGGNGNNWTLPNVLSPLAAHKNDLMMFRRVQNYYGDSHNEGGGDHARSIGTFLTSAHARYGEGHPSADFGLPSPGTLRIAHSGPTDTNGFAKFHRENYGNKIVGSADQVAAKLAWNNSYNLKSLQVRVGGGGDSHHNDVYRHLSFSSYNTPAPRFQNLQNIFDTIYGRRPQEQDGSDDLRRAIDKSILDTVPPAVQRINRKVGAEDKQRLDKYLTEVREIEKQISNSNSGQGITCSLGAGERPSQGNPRFDEHIRTSLRLFVKAFQCDITRVVTHGWHYGSFNFLKDASGRTLDLETHNGYSHHGSKEKNREGLRRINTYWAQLFSEFLTELKQNDDNYSGTLLDNSQILFGCGMMDGNSHNSERGNAELPIICAGGAGGKWTPGKLVDTGAPIRLSNIHLNMLKNMGYTGTSFGDSNNGNLKL